MMQESEENRDLLSSRPLAKDGTVPKRRHTLLGTGEGRGKIEVVTVHVKPAADMSAHSSKALLILVLSFLLQYLKPYKSDRFV